MNRPFFIIGCVKSGTTAMAKILDIATNAVSNIEDAPKFCIESRDYHEGRISKIEMIETPYDL